MYLDERPTLLSLIKAQGIEHFFICNDRNCKEMLNKELSLEMSGHAWSECSTSEQ
jgi:hypothetical protein